MREDECIIGSAADELEAVIASKEPSITGSDLVDGIHYEESGSHLLNAIRTYPKWKLDLFGGE